MKTLGEALTQVRSAGEPLPNDGQCPVCGYFDITHPDVRRILTDRDATKRIYNQAQCKCASREQQLVRDAQLRYAQAALPSAGNPRTFDNFITLFGTDGILAAARRFANREGPKMLVMIGHTGAGKSHLLEAIGRYALEHNRTVRYDLTSTFLTRLRHTYESDTGEDIHDLTAWYQRRDTLLLDDIGIEAATPWVKEQLTTLVEERLHSGGWLALATNLSKAEMSTRMGERLSSRVYADNPELPEVAVVYTDAKDYRA